MEDYELVSRLRKHGPPAIIPHAMQTSGRRWQSVGFLQTTLTNQVSMHINVVKHAVWWMFCSPDSSSCLSHRARVVDSLQKCMQNSAGSGIRISVLCVMLQAIILAYHCGVPMSTLASWYRQGMR